MEVTDQFGGAEERYVLERAYVPEHVVPLLTILSGGRPFLVDDWFGVAGDGGVILVGYPLESRFSEETAAEVRAIVRRRFEPERLRYIAPEAREADEIDEYLVLDLDDPDDPKLARTADRARETLTVTRGGPWTADHDAVVTELAGRVDLPPSVRALYDAMPTFVAATETGHLLDARDSDGGLAAFFVVETAAARFDAYLLGGYSRGNYVPHASDLLFSGMIEDARSRGKQTIELGLAVNDGIRRFKTKWGGRVERPYAYREFRSRAGFLARLFRSFTP